MSINFNSIILVLITVVTSISIGQTKPSISFDPISGNYLIQYQSEGTGIVVQEVFEPSTKIKPNIMCIVNLVSGTGLIKYNYTVSNGAQSEQRLSIFELKVLSDELNTKSPLQSWNVSLYGRVPVLSFAEFKNESGLPNPFDGIAPDSSLSGFSILTNGLPTISDAYFTGRNTIYLSYPDDGPPETIKDSLTTLRLFPANRIQKRTLAPKTIPNPFEPLTFIEAMIDMGDEADTLNWLGSSTEGENVWLNLKNNLEDTRKFIELENPKVAIIQIENLLSAVYEYYKNESKLITDEGYALMYFNGKYLLEYLKQN